jgi:hypothetical protein
VSLAPHPAFLLGRPPHPPTSDAANQLVFVLLELFTKHVWVSLKRDTNDVDAFAVGYPFDDRHVILVLFLDLLKLVRRG